MDCKGDVFSLLLQSDFTQTSCQAGDFKMTWLDAAPPVQLCYPLFTGVAAHFVCSVHTDLGRKDTQILRSHLFPIVCVYILMCNTNL